MCPGGPAQRLGAGRVARGGSRLELRCLDHSRQDHGQIVNMAWRAIR